MATGKDSFFERFLAPVAKLLINQEELQRLYNQTDWQAVCDRFQPPGFTYPAYYREQNFHGIAGGYLNPNAAISYDPITQYALPPSETMVREGLTAAVRCKPRRILDLGCGTGSTTLMLKRSFPEAEVVGVDLSPYMLAVAEQKAEAAGLTVRFCHGNAEHLGFPSASFDLITAALLFHETPPDVSRTILRESYRLLTVGGEVLALDGNQKTLRQVDWLNHIFEEPYIEGYAAGSLDAWMGAAGFSEIQTHDVWFLHQITRGVKPIEERAQIHHPHFAEVSVGSWQAVPGF